MMLEQGYCAHLFAMRYSLAQQLLAGGASDLYRLFNSAFDGGPRNPDYVIHIPGALASIPEINVAEASANLNMATSDHLRRRGIAAQVAPGSGTMLPAIHVRRSAAQGKTTVIIPTRNRLPLLKRCLQSISPATDAIAADILVIDNDSSEPETLEYLAQIASETVQVLRVPGPVNCAIAFNDVDYCLKLRAAGKRVVFTPHAKLWHLESASRGRDDKPDRKSRFARELQALRAKWSQSIVDDPYYSPVLSLDSIPYSALAWPPRVMKPRALMNPGMNDIPPGF